MGLVASLSRPGGNATGISLLTTAPEAKRLGILHELAPRAAVVGVLIDPNYQQAEDQARELREAAKALNLQIEIALAGKDQELESGEGTGLGLSISHDIIVKQHSGSIEVESLPGEFTEARIVLPRAFIVARQVGL